MAVHCLKSGWIGLYIPDNQEITRGPRDISRAEGNLEVGGDVQPNSSRFEAEYSHSLIINPSLGMYQEIHPCRASSTYSVKINTSLPMMREWQIWGGDSLNIISCVFIHPQVKMFSVIFTHPRSCKCPVKDPKKLYNQFGPELLLFGQLQFEHLSIWTNTFCQFGQIHFAAWTNIHSDQEMVSGNWLNIFWARLRLFGKIHFAFGLDKHTFWSRGERKLAEHFLGRSCC